MGQFVALSWFRHRENCLSQERRTYADTKSPRYGIAITRKWDVASMVIVLEGRDTGREVAGCLEVLRETISKESYYNRIWSDDEFVFILSAAGNSIFLACGCLRDVAFRTPDESPNQKGHLELDAESIIAASAAQGQKSIITTSAAVKSSLESMM
jgi:hypothetical protein